MASWVTQLARTLLLTRRHEQGNAFEEALERLGSAIRLGFFEVGGQLPPERELADQLGVSRATLREAIRLLTEQGTLVSRRGRGGGTFVVATPAPPTLAEMQTTLSDRGTSLREILDQRAAVEIALAGLAAERATARQSAELTALLPRLRAATRDTFEYRRLDTEFHLLLGAAAHSARLHLMLAESHRELSELMAAVPHSDEIRSHSSNQHELIASAIARKDPDAARAVMAEHVRATSSFLKGLLDGVIR